MWIILLKKKPNFLKNTYLVNIRYVGFQCNQVHMCISLDVVVTNIVHLFRSDRRYMRGHKSLEYIYLDLSIHRPIDNRFHRVELAYIGLANLLLYLVGIDT